jgi:hypothetical protein
MENPYTTRVKNLEQLPQYFFLGTLPEELKIETPPVLRTIVESFNTNLRALYWATKIPYLLSFFSAYNRALDRIMISERILSLDTDDISKKQSDPSYEKSEAYLKKLKEDEAKASKRASEKFAAKHLTPDGKRAIEGQAIDDLVPLLKSEVVCTASKELLRQSIVLLWVALEALATDLFVVALNSNPELTIHLLKDDYCKKRFQSRDLAKVIEQHGFDLSNKMGEVLKSLGNLDDPETIKAVFQVVCPNNESLRTSLAQPALWKLYQRRNLFVHRAGVVDKAFLDRTGEKLELGVKLNIVSDDVDKYLALVGGVGKELVAATAKVVT